jgi:hypothetical protein
MKGTAKAAALMVIVTLVVGYVQFYGIDQLVLNSDELFRARALISDDWDLFKVAWPAGAVREEFNNWPMHLPPGLGVLMRLAVVVFGPQHLHLALRFWPWLLGVIGIWAIYALYRTIGGRRFAWLVIPLAALACNQTFEFCKSMKHYTADMVFCSLQYIFAWLIYQHQRPRDWLWLALISAAGFWFAFGTPFTTAAIWAGLLLALLFESPKTQSSSIRPLWLRFALASLLVALSGIGIYLLIVRQAIHNQNFISHISHSGLQLFDWSQAGSLHYWLRYLGRAAYHTLRVSVFFFRDNWIFGMAANLSILGWTWVSLRQRQWFAPLILITPWLLIIVGSFADVFPLQAYRVISFLLPAWIVMIILGWRCAYDYLRAKNRVVANGALALLLVAVSALCWLNLRDSFYLRFGGGRKVDKAMNALMQNAQDGDTVFLHWGAILPFYVYGTDHQPGYLNTYPIKNAAGGRLQVLYGDEHRNNLAAYEPQFEQVEAVPGRLWVAFCHNWPSADMLTLKQRLQARRTLLQVHDFKKCQVLLFAPISQTNR